MDLDAIVVGSGFGGTVAASQLVGKGKRVLVIERGGWWVSPLNLARPPKVPPMVMRRWLETVWCRKRSNGAVAGAAHRRRLGHRRSLSGQSDADNHRAGAENDERGGAAIAPLVVSE